MPILNKKIKYRTSYKMKNVFEDNGFTVDNDRYLDIDIIDLVKILPSSTLKVEYECDKCHNIFESKICNINKNTGIDKLDNTYCRQCGQENTLLKNHGVACPFSSKKIRDKAKDTMKERYGVEYAMQNNNIKEKAKQTVQEHYGEQYTSSAQVPEIREKMLKSFQEKHGYEYQSPMQSVEVQQKAKNTMKERYGAEHALQVPEFKEKAIHTLQEHYGEQYINSLQVPEIKEKAINTLQERYGCTNPMQSEIIKEKVSATIKKNNIIEQEQLLKDFYGNNIAKINKLLY